MIKKFASCVLSFFVFSSGSLFDLQHAVAQDIARCVVPAQEYDSAHLRGVRYDPTNPFDLDFIISQGDEASVSTQDRCRIVRYFLTALTVPEDKLWVNLSPYEQDRIIDDSLVGTEMGEVLLEQDYFLKQLASSLTHPDTPLGRAYWDAVPSRAQASSKLHSQAHRQVEIVDLSRIWIKPESLSIYDGGNTVFISDAVLKAESDGQWKTPLLSVIKQDVNTGRNFAPLRQMMYSSILAQWFKRKFAGALYQFYYDSGKTAGLDVSDPELKEEIFKRYVKAFESGAYDITRKVTDEKGRLKKRQYFCGGASSSINAVISSGLIQKIELSTLSALFEGTRFILQKVMTALTLAEDAEQVAGRVWQLFGPEKTRPDNILELHREEIEARTSSAFKRYGFTDKSSSSLNNNYAKKLTAAVAVIKVVILRNLKNKRFVKKTERFFDIKKGSIYYGMNADDFNAILEEKISSKHFVYVSENKGNYMKLFKDFLIAVGKDDDAEHDYLLAVLSSAINGEIPIDTVASFSLKYYEKASRPENGGIGLDGFFDGVNVSSAASEIHTDPVADDAIVGVSFKLVGDGELLPLEGIISLP